MAKAHALRAVQAIRAPVPTGEGTLYVEGVPALRMDDHEYVRAMVARYCVRVALEKGCTRIVVRHPRRDPIVFDVLDTLTDAARAVGFWPRLHLPTVPANLATTGFRGLGADLDRHRPQIVVPVGLPVSGEAGGKETV